MSDEKRIRWRSVLLLVIAVLVIRGGFLVAKFDSLSDDPDAYRVIAETLSQTGVFGLPTGETEARPTAFRPPLYPWLLSWFVGDDGQLPNLAPALLHLLLGGITVVLTWDIARRLMTTLSAWLAAALVLFDPILLWQSTLIMTETIAATLVVVFWWWWVVRIMPTPTDDLNVHCETDRRTGYVNAAIAGTLLLLTILCRPTFLVWSALLIPSMWFALTRCRIRRLALIATTATIIVTGVGLWTIRNLSVIGHPVWATTHGGYTLLLANNDSFYDYLEQKPWQLPWKSEAWDPSEFFQTYGEMPRTGDEWADDRVAYNAAKSTIRSRPQTFWYSCVVRLARLWQPFPHATNGRSTASIAAVGIYQSLIYACILAAAYRHRANLHPSNWRRWIPWWPAVALVLTLSAVHAVYWSNPRMRSPAIPILAITATTLLHRPATQHFND